MYHTCFQIRFSDLAEDKKKIGREVGNEPFNTACSKKQQLGVFRCFGAQQKTSVSTHCCGAQVVGTA
jgi:hypothetical protein